MENGNIFWSKLVDGQMPVAVELDPPVGVDLTKYTEGIRSLKAAGVDIITMADCPSGHPRMDSSIAACMMHGRECVDVIPHITCRDRNSISLQAVLTGLYAEGIRNIIMVTGDGVPKEERDTVKSVFQFSSRGAIAFAGKVTGEFPEAFHIFAALNLNAVNFGAELKIAKDKLEKGAAGFFTQPVLTTQAFENLKIARKELDGFIMGGVIPVVSEKNGRFMNECIPGINVDEKLIEMYAGKDKEAAEALAIEVSSYIAGQMKPYIDGLYLMTPFLRVGMMEQIIENFRDPSHGLQ